MGSPQAEKPLVGEEGVRPAVMVRPSAATLLPLPSAKQTAKTHPDPTVEAPKRPLVGVLEVFKPAAKRGVQLRDDLREAFAGGPFGLRSDRVLELGQALRPRTARATLETITQEVKALCLHVDDQCLRRVQRQAGGRRPLLNRLQG